MSSTAKLRCFSCGEMKQVLSDKPVVFGFQLVKLANESGMKGVFDKDNKRVLIFCNDECENKQKTKDGRYRKYAKK